MLKGILNLRLRTKVFGLISIMIVGFGLFTVVSFDTLNTVQVNGPVYKDIIESKDLVADILPPPAYLVESYLLVLQMLEEQDRSKLDGLIRKSARLRKEYESRQQHWKTALAPGPLRDEMVVRSYEPGMRFLDLRDREFIPAIEKGDQKTAQALAQGELKRAYEEHRHAIDEVVVMANKKAVGQEKKARSIIAWRTSIQLAVALVAVIISSLAAYILTRYINGTVNTCLGFAAQVARGDLTARLDSRSTDELGTLGTHLNSMAENLSRMAVQIRNGTQEIASATNGILAMVRQLATSSAKTSSAMTETSATVEEVKQAAQLANEKARNVAETSGGAVSVSEAGKKATEDSISGMHLIRDQMESISETVVRLSERGEAIGNVIATVQDLAEQSNLLAVNASIEAARAGEQGKGFVVVAQEIKTLADQSRDATSQVRGILDDTRKWIGAVVTATEEGINAVSSGVEQSAAAGEAIVALATHVDTTSQAAAVIHSTSEQQVQGVDQVSAAVGSVTEALHQNAAGAKQLEEAARKLEALGESLTVLVDQYTV